MYQKRTYVCVFNCSVVKHNCKIGGRRRWLNVQPKRSSGKTHERPLRNHSSSASKHKPYAWLSDNNKDTQELRSLFWTKHDISALGLIGKKRVYVKSEWDVTGERPRKVYKLTAEGQNLLQVTEEYLNIICRKIGALGIPKLSEEEISHIITTPIVETAKRIPK